jgi:hypothetical protein
MWQWQWRIMFGAGRLASLDSGTELWNWDIDAYESAAGIRAAYTRSGKPFDDNLVLYDATQSLLRDVVHAAGGVESAYQRLTRSVAAAQASHDEWATGPGANLTKGPEPELGTGWSDRHIEDAWYAVAEMIVWARTLDERLRRDVKNGPDQGLIPALALGSRRDAVIAARSRLLTTHLGSSSLIGVGLGRLWSGVGATHSRCPIARRCR